MPVMPSRIRQRNRAFESWRPVPRLLLEVGPSSRKQRIARNLHSGVCGNNGKSPEDICGSIGACFRVCFGKSDCSIQPGTGGYCVVWLLKHWPHHYSSSVIFHDKD